ncbi:MAG TPA: hypothetical protein VMM38_09445 [Aridibacter sp.]|nr:hypothetical protein [Aridibacter sp.]
MKIKILTLITLFAFTIAVSPFNLAKQYEVELVVQDGKKSKETDAVLHINEENFEVVPKKNSFKKDTKNFEFSSVKVADYSHSKKPMLSGGGAVATALLVGFIFAIPFLFMKKKSHWLTVQTEDDFAVLKLSSNNYRAVIAEFETHGVKVNEVEEEKDKK